jgi:hypothetical protein
VDAVTRLAALLAAMAVAGCASTWEGGEPVSPASHAGVEDAVPRYAGKLRRLVPVPTYFEPVERECSPRPVAEIARELDEAARAFLVDWKGYEVIAPGEAHADLARELGRWQEREPESRLPPPELRATLQRLAAAHGADGVVVLHAAPECIGVLDTTLMMLAVGMPSFYGKALGRNFSAGLYEGASGALVWQRRVSLGPRQEPRAPQEAGKDIENLLGLLENAIPEILLR